MRRLLTWIGSSDLVAAARDRPDEDPGPVLRLLRAEAFDAVHLLNDLPWGEGTLPSGRAAATPLEFQAWLARLAGLPLGAVLLHTCPEGRLRNQYDRTYEFTRSALRRLRDADPEAACALLLSPGTPAAQVAMIVAARVYFGDGAEMFNSFRPEGGDPPGGVERVRVGGVSGSPDDRGTSRPRCPSGCSCSAATICCWCATPPTPCPSSSNTPGSCKATNSPTTSLWKLVSAWPSSRTPFRSTGRTNWPSSCRPVPRC